MLTESYHIGIKVGMQLADYLAKQNISRSDFADAIGVKEPSVSRYITGKNIPERDVMRKIVSVTAGNVTANDFYGVPQAASGMQATG